MAKAAVRILAGGTAIALLATAFAGPERRASADAPITREQPASFTFLDNGQIRVGASLDLGGAITWLSRSGDQTNLVNNWDWGRQIQMSFYAGPIPFTPGGKQPAPEWRDLGWNPIQCGDHFHNKARVIDSRNDGKKLTVHTQPMQWPLNNVPGDCEFESELSLEGSTVRAHCTLHNRRADLTQYAARDQELPALYTNGRWWRLMTYSGDKPFTGDKLEQKPPVMPWTRWNATENWAALVDDNGRGLGIWTPGRYTYIGGFSGKPGAGGTADGPTGYISSLQTEVLDHDIDYAYDYVLILGSVDEIRKYVYDHSKPGKPPDWRFENDRQHWQYHDAVDTGWPIRNELNITTNGADPYFTSPLCFWQAADAPFAHIEAAFDHTMAEAHLRWRRFDASGSADQEVMNFPVTPDGAFHSYDVRLADAPMYRGGVVALRIDPIVAAGEAGHIRVRRVSLRSQ